MVIVAVRFKNKFNYFNQIGGFVMLKETFFEGDVYNVVDKIDDKGFRSVRIQMTSTKDDGSKLPGDVFITKKWSGALPKIGERVRMKGYSMANIGKDGKLYINNKVDELVKIDTPMKEARKVAV